MAVALALGAALFYGASDFCGGLASRRRPALLVALWSQGVGLAVLAVALALVPGTVRAADLAWGGLCGLAGAAAVLLFYRALAVGLMGVVSPLTAVTAAIVPAIWGLARGERPAPLALAGIVLALAAIGLVSAAPPADAAPAGPPLARPARRPGLPPGIPEALGASAAFGLFFIAIAQTQPGCGLYPLLSMRLVSLAALLATAAVLRRPIRLAAPGAGLVALTGALDMTANVCFFLAVHGGALSIVAVLTSLYPAGTVGLAAAVLRERLRPVQWLGVGVALAGVVCIASSR